MAKIEIKGPIISDGDQRFYDWYGMPATSPSVVNKALSAAKDGEDIEVTINSGGGLVWSGSEIYTALKSHKGKVTAKIVGVAASAASFIAMAADNVQMSPTATMMIHRGQFVAAGDKNDFEHIADVLSGIDESIAMAYQIKTKIPTGELLDMMSKETWLNAMKAKDLGFADGIMFEDEASPTNAIADVSGMLPQAVIDKMRLELAEKPPDELEQPSAATPDNTIAIAKEKLILSMKLNKMEALTYEVFR